MQRKSIELLDIATEKEPLAYWTKKLDLSRGALHQCKFRGNLSPAIAWALAEELGEDPQPWALLAAAEGERDSAAKSRMLKSIAATVLTTAVMGGASHAMHTTTAIEQPIHRIYYGSCRYTTRRHIRRCPNRAPSMGAFS